MSLESTLTVAGNVVADPEMRQTNEGKPVGRVRIAIPQRKFNQQSKQWEDGDSIFMNAVAFGPMAEHMASTLSKGMRVIIVGRLKQDEWTDKESGVTRQDKSIVIEEIGASLLFDSFVKADRARRSAPQGDDGFGGQGGWATSDETPF